MKLILALFLATYLASCATPYQPQGLLGGYSEMQLGQDEFQVIFNGNGFTSDTAVFQGWLHRCAEVASLNGQKYFQVINSSGSTDVTEIGGSINCNGYSYGNNIDLNCQEYAPQKIYKHSMRGTIKLWSIKTKRSKFYDASIILGQFPAEAH